MLFKFKKVSRLFIVVSLLFTIFLAPINNSFANETTNYSSDRSESTKEIIIVHTNDTHSRLKEDESEGMGFAKIATKIKALKSSNPNVLLLDAGDTLHGKPISSISKGESVVEVMNTVGYDAMVPGNHDFNYGQDRLLELSKKMKFPLISSNIIKEDRSKYLTSYVIKEVDGIKIGIFGLSTPETTYKTNPKNVKGLTFKNPIESAKEMVSELKEKRVDVVVALTHLGLDESSIDTSQKVADNVSGIDLIIDGHSHTTLEKGKWVGNTLIAQTGDYDKNLGIVTLKFEGNKVTSKEAKLFTKEEAKLLNPDKSVLDIISKIEEDNKKITSQIIGKSNKRLDGERESVRAGETNLSNLITDAMIKYSGADIAITNGGGIRASIEAGEITKGNIIDVLPFGNYAVLKEIRGSNIVKALEHGTSDYPKSKGAFPQVGGLTYTLNLFKSKGNRVTNVKVNGVPIDLNKSYKVVTNDFMAAGGDGYTMLEDEKLLLELPALDEIVIEYIQQLEIVTGDFQNRIKVINKIKKIKMKHEEKKFEKTQEKIGEQDYKDTYTVKSGDALYQIAKMFRTTWQNLLEYNNLIDPNKIIPGQKILIP
ncbi:bifunctional UDP-sugar hydrolase/5'-nucleotidase periplasmic precursor UshA [Gottschalkia purinilytica]|uniref:Bifunctional UDP-sugar hydrolase/5'-nucleotidase periplasmic UshA n=1 Tax=Gottschalkia purinilytica TaxID=1503 RepID=A0A0L0WE03_GOTPU|nr:5'-nucleotidase C-terminal domain-containing protein [Gottschalkia purinilytica]KNF09708.1 bifunctional UDP-sugar hydrolase/5'-nucleotidase periplasmic precursor UshA [Gottschalkia purinilytica]